MTAAPHALDVDLVQETPAVVLRLTGDLDLATADKLVTAAESALARVRSSTEFVLDLSGVMFCDSAGISAMVTLRRLTERSGMELRVTNPQPQVRRVLEVTGLTSYLNLE